MGNQVQIPYSKMIITKMNNNEPQKSTVGISVSWDRKEDLWFPYLLPSTKQHGFRANIMKPEKEFRELCLQLCLPNGATPIHVWFLDFFFSGFNSIRFIVLL